MGQGREGKKEAITEKAQYVRSYWKVKDSIVKETLQPSPEIFDQNAVVGVMLLLVLNFNGLFLLHVVI